MLAQPPEILYRDDWFLAVNKPAGIIVHSDGTANETLSSELIDWGLVYGREADDLQALQRLDRETSGIVLFSLKKKTQPQFDAMIAERNVTKRYRAISQGYIEEDVLEITDPIGRDRHDARKMRVSPTGKRAHTTVHILNRFHADGMGPERTSLLVDLHTGRKHQIRVHLAHVGHPLLGDTLYGSSQSQKHGLMLHAAHMAFNHPVTKEDTVIDAPLPQRFIDLERPDSPNL